jgi:xyloglucan-specific exo-beta-1,4-glucanase
MGSLTGIFLSQDLGEKWLLLSNKDMQFSSLRLIMGDPNIFGRLYIGTDGRGIFYGDLKLKSKTGK